MVASARVAHLARRAADYGVTIESPVAIDMKRVNARKNSIVDADNQEILGAAILGLNGDEVVHGLLDIMYARQPYTAISCAVHIHPIVSELIPTVLQDLKPLA